MKRTLLQLFISIFSISILTSGAAAKNIEKDQLLEKRVLNGVVNPDLKRIITYGITNGTSFQSTFANYVFSEFTTKSAMNEDSVNVAKTEFEYFETHSLQTYSTWENNQWIETLQLFIYRPASQILYDSLIYKSYDSEQMTFNSYLKYVNYFDSNGNDTLNVGSQYNNDNNTWDEAVKTQNYFLDNNNVYMEIEYFWNDQTSQWEKSFKTSYAYDNNELIFVYEDLYNTDEEHWESYRKATHDRNETKNYYSVIDSIYDFWSLDYNPTYLEVFSGHDNTIDTAIYFEWNTTFEDWEADQLHSYNYNANGDILSIDYFLNENYSNKSASDNTMSFQKGLAEVYVYNDNATGIEEITNNSIQVFPNPTQNKVILQVINPVECRLEIIDMKGITISTEKIISNSTQINIQNFNKGIYLFRINNNGTTTTHKIVKN